MRSRLNLSIAREVSTMILDALDDSGYRDHELIPGLVQAIIVTADGDDGLLDEAANFLADGGVGLEAADDADEDQ